MSELDPVVVGEQSAQILLHLLGIVVLRQPEASREAMDMCIDHKSGADAEPRPEDDVRRFPSDAWEHQEFFHRARHSSPEPLDQQRARAADILGFCVEEAGGADDGFEVTGAALHDGLRGRHGCEERGSDLIDPFIGALRREDRRDQQLERSAMEQCAAGVAVLSKESVGDGSGLGSRGLGSGSGGSRGRGSACGHVGASVVRRPRIPRPLRILGIPVRIESRRLT